MFPSATEVVIVGGGPAGTAAALTLARYTECRCVLIEASGYETARVGENVSPAVLPLLAFLGVAPPAAPGEGIVLFGSEAAWGSGELVQRTSLFSGQGPGWSLDRGHFDAVLADAAEAAGVTVLRRAMLRDAAREASGDWRLHFDRGRTMHTLLARQVVDASGRSAAFARRIGARRRVFDRLVGVTAYAKLAPGTALAQIMLVEAAPNGWWYAAPLPGSLAVLALMTDADLIRRLDGSVEQFFAHGLARTEHVRARYGRASLVTAPRVHPAETQTLTPPIAPGWVAAGDAAASFDPLSSLGIGHALASGIQAARIVHARLRGDETLATAYPGDIARNQAAYAQRWAMIYANERRWPEQTFWRRRQAVTFHRQAGPSSPQPALEEA